MSMYEVNSVLVNHILEITEYPIVWEGKNTTPDYSNPYLEVVSLPSMMDGVQTWDKYGGVYQINIHHPLNTGLPVLYKDADSIVSSFTPNSLLNYDDTYVRIKSRYIGSLSKTKDSLVLSVYVSWRSSFKQN